MKSGYPKPHLLDIGCFGRASTYALMLVASCFVNSITDPAKHMRGKPAFRRSAPKHCRDQISSHSDARLDFDPTFRLNERFFGDRHSAVRTPRRFAKTNSKP